MPEFRVWVLWGEERIGNRGNGGNGGRLLSFRKKKEAKKTSLGFVGRMGCRGGSRPGHLLLYGLRGRNKPRHCEAQT